MLLDMSVERFENNLIDFVSIVVIHCFVVHFIPNNSHILHFNQLPHTIILPSDFPTQKHVVAKNNSIRIKNF